MLELSRATVCFVVLTMPRPHLNRDAGKLVSEVFQGCQRMMYVQFDGTRILANECLCGQSVPTIVCPVDQHRWNAMLILQANEDEST